MSSNSPMTQYCLAHACIDTLQRCGITEWGVAPGSRATPLVSALYQQGCSPLCHADERGLGFWALGTAKHTGRPAVVVVTSGTAVANLLPAVIEAHYSQTPMIILTADRPHDQVGVHANQAIDQSSLLHPFARTIDLPVPATEAMVRYWVDTMAFATAHSGPIQLNCRIHAPFDLALPMPTVLPVTQLHTHDATPPLMVTVGPHDVVIVGHMPPLTLPQRLALGAHWATSGIPIIIDGPTVGEHPNMTPSFPGLDVSGASRLIWVGERVLSVDLQSQIQSFKGEVCHLVASPHSHDPGHRSKTVWVTPYTAIRFSPVISAFSPMITAQYEAYVAHRSSLLARYPDSEWALIDRVMTQRPAGWGGLIGNSLPIRWWSSLRDLSQEWVMNRGASGIDGMVATAAGLLTHGPVMAILGDQTVRHDASSLPLWRGHDGLLVIVNNNGGRIFDTLPIRSHPACEPLFVAPHDQGFEWASALSGLPYWVARTQTELGQLLPTALSQGGILELAINPSSDTVTWSMLGARP